MRSVLDVVVNGQIAVRLRNATEPDDPVTGQRRAVSANVKLLARARQHERAVRARIDEREPVLALLDPSVQSRNEITSNDDVVVL